MPTAYCGKSEIGGKSFNLEYGWYLIFSRRDAPTSTGNGAYRVVQYCDRYRGGSVDRDVREDIGNPEEEEDVVPADCERSMGASG
ncbi:hypothetical protein NM688_g1064 [Phlebia brevispora]|uniref:Uncharacterized protein n=1 Tax=Phlebia brevispora TaxID=194682 RepID=A0ACC1TC87_9APHY|nr:hypothetical protein NM688_g1064 [Phlebia brevispora]